LIAIIRYGTGIREYYRKKTEEDRGWVTGKMNLILYHLSEKDDLLLNIS
jgi:hypothetical protein